MALMAPSLVVVATAAANPAPLVFFRRRCLCSAPQGRPSTTTPATTRLLPLRAAEPRSRRRLVTVSASSSSSDQSSASASSSAGAAAAAVTAATAAAAAAAASPTTASAAAPRGVGVGGNVAGGPPPPRAGALPFDTPLAIALAGAAFEAYNSPTAAGAGAGAAEATGATAEESPSTTPAPFDFVDADGTRTTYLDPAVLLAASSGGVVATVKVTRAEGLPASDAWGTSDPYFLATLDGGAARQSAVAPRTRCPTFDDEFELYVSRSPPPPSKPDQNDSNDPLDSVLRISMFDSDALTADDALGSAEVTLRELTEKSAAAAAAAGAGGGGEVELKLVAPPEGGGGGGGGGGAPAPAPAGSVFVTASVRTLTASEIEDRASGNLAPDGSSEVARMSRAWRSLAKAAAAAAATAAAEKAKNDDNKNKNNNDDDDDDMIFSPVAFIENPASDTQLWIGVDSATRRIVVAFRGTETTKILDVLTDLNASWAPLDARAPDGEPGSLPLPGYARVSPRTAAEGGPPLVLDTEGLWCHQGFLAAYRSVRCSVLRVLGECFAAEKLKSKSEEGGGDSASASQQQQQHQPWTLLFTGHSLGGALATLCSYECAHLKFTDAEEDEGEGLGGGGGVERLVVYNYGSPRVGSAAFAAHFDASVADAWRIFNAADLVPRIPRLLGYAHVGCAVPLKADGTFDDEAIAENYAAGMYGDGDYVPVAAAASSFAAPAAAPATGVPLSSSLSSSSSSTTPVTTTTAEPVKVFDEEGANPLIAAKALASAAASALFGASKRKGEGSGGGGGGEASSGQAGEVAPSEKQAAADAVSKLISSEIKTMNDFLSGDAVSHHTESVYLEVLKKAVDAASDLARELEEESRGENVAGEVEAAAQKAAEAAKELIEEANKS